MNIVELKDKKIRELNVMAKNFKIDGAAGMRKQDLIFALLQAEIEKTGLIFGEGTLEILPDGFGTRSRRHLCITFTNTPF